MLRTVLSAVSPRVAVANRSLLPAARRLPLTALASSPRPQGGRSLALDCCAATAAAASRSVAARKCSRRDMSSASAKAATLGSDDSRATEGGGGGDGQGEEDTAGSGRDARDPLTGEGIWMDEEDEPLVLEKPKKIQKFCGKVVSDNMDKTIKVAIPYWYYVKKLGRRIVRYSKIMAHDEGNTANIGDTVILVDCKQQSKRKKHKLLAIVRKLPRLDDA